MEYLLLYQHEPMGKVVEPEADFGMGVVIGRFLPFPAYEQVRPVFRLYAQLVGTGQDQGEKLKEYHRQRDALTRAMSITTATGLPVQTLWIDLLDFSEFLEHDAYQVHFCVAYEGGAFFHNHVLWESKPEEPPR